MEVPDMLLRANSIITTAVENFELDAQLTVRAQKWLDDFNKTDEEVPE